MKWLKRWKTQTLLLLAVIGPGFITANVDNDACGIYTYSFAGAQFGYKPLFTIIPMALALIVIQEMSARMGAITGKGLSAQQKDMQSFVRTLLNWRKMQTTVHHGKLMHFVPENGTYAWFRYDADSTVMVVINKNAT